MFKFSNKLLSPLSLWYNSFVFYKSFIMRTLYVFFLFSLVSHLAWYGLNGFHYFDIQSATKHLDDTGSIIPGFAGTLIFYLGTLYLIFFSLALIYSRSENGKLLRGKINKKLFHVIIKLVAATVLFYYFFVSLPGVIVGYIIFRILIFFQIGNAVLTRDAFLAITSSPLMFLCYLPMLAIMITAANYFIFYCLNILFSARKVGISQSFIMSFDLVKGNYWRNLFVLLPAALLWCAAFYGIPMLCNYVGTNFAGTLSIKIFIAIARSIFEAFLVPLSLSLLLIQHNDLEMRRY